MLEGGLFFANEEALEPAFSAVIAHHVARDREEPPALVRAVEALDLPPRDQEHLLREILEIGGGAAQRADPTAGVVEPTLVERVEPARRVGVRVTAHGIPVNVDVERMRNGGHELRWHLVRETF